MDVTSKCYVSTCKDFFIMIPCVFPSVVSALTVYLWFRNWLQSEGVLIFQLNIAVNVIEKFCSFCVPSSTWQSHLTSTLHSLVNKTAIIWYYRIHWFWSITFPIQLDTKVLNVRWCLIALDEVPDYLYLILKVNYLIQVMMCISHEY